MNKFISKMSMNDINEYMKEALKNEQVNLFKLFVMKEKNTKLSVTISPDPKYVGRYHGLHPIFSESYLRKILFDPSYDLSCLEMFWKNIYALQGQDSMKLFDIITENNGDESFKNLSELECIF